jgi:hypothetical protein
MAKFMRIFKNIGMFILALIFLRLIIAVDYVRQQPSQRDSDECRYEASKALAKGGKEYSDRLIIGSEINKLTTQCYRARGFTENRERAGECDARDTYVFYFDRCWRKPVLLRDLIREIEQYLFRKDGE